MAAELFEADLLLQAEASHFGADGVASQLVRQRSTFHLSIPMKSIYSRATPPAQCSRGENTLRDGTHSGAHRVRRLAITRPLLAAEGEAMAISSETRREHTEGQVAKTIEEQTAKLPSDLFLWAAIGSITASATLHLMGNKPTSVFVGQWAPTFLILGLYNKLVKQQGSDFTDRQGTARV